MSTDFPSSLDSLSNPTSPGAGQYVWEDGTIRDAPSGDSAIIITPADPNLVHSAQHANANDAIEALEAKVGTDGSGVTTSLDYLLKSTSSLSPGHQHATSELTDFASAVTALAQNTAKLSGLTNNGFVKTTGGDGTLAVDSTTYIAASAIDTDPTLAADSDARLPSQKAIKSYLDNALTGLYWKASVRAATTANGALSTAFASGSTLDGVTLAAGDRILLKNQTAGAENGIYVVNASGAPTRSADADTGTELVSATVFAREGTANAGTQWTCTNDSVTVGSTSLTFAQVSGAGTYSAGSGLTLAGNQFSVPAGGVTNAMLAGSITASKLVGTDINTVGTVTGGVWNAGTVTVATNINSGVDAVNIVNSNAGSSATARINIFRAVSVLM